MDPNKVTKRDKVSWQLQSQDFTIFAAAAAAADPAAVAVLDEVDTGDIDTDDVDIDDVDTDDVDTDDDDTGDGDADMMVVEYREKKIFNSEISYSTSRHQIIKSSNHSCFNFFRFPMTYAYHIHTYTYIGVS